MIRVLYGERRLFWTLGLFLAVNACGLEVSDQDAEYSGSVLVWNRSQFDIEALHVHVAGGFALSENLLDAPLGLEEVKWAPFTAGQYVTVVREKVLGGRMLRVTTGRTPDIQKDKSVLIVFDDSFRLVQSGQISGVVGFPGYPTGD